VIIFDGEQELTSAASGYLSDPRIRNYTIPKVGESNFAGILRNYGMSKDECAEWFAFVDDDDVLSPDYVARLLEETRLNTLVQTVIFRMTGIYRADQPILPPKEDVMFVMDRVGISFAIQKSVFQSGFWFQSSSKEDSTILF